MWTVLNLMEIPSSTGCRYRHGSEANASTMNLHFLHKLNRYQTLNKESVLRTSGKSEFVPAHATKTYMGCIGKVSLVL
jgi:hypothetical protein